MRRVEHQGFIIAVKVTKDYWGNVKETPEWQYAQYDNEGPMASGYPCFGWISRAKRFESTEQAKEWWTKNARYLVNEIKRKCDATSLAIVEYSHAFLNAGALSIEDITPYGE